MLHYSPFAEHASQRQMYETLRRTFYWHHIAADFDYVVRNFASCARNNSMCRHRFNKPLSPASEPLEISIKNSVGPFPKMVHSNHYNLVTTDRYLKLARADQASKTTATHGVNVVIDDWLVSYGIPTYLLTLNATQFVTKNFATVCAPLKAEQLTTATYHPETRSQAERSNKVISISLQHYVAKHQKDYDAFVQQLIYTYSTQVHRLTEQTPFDLVLSRHSPRPTLLESVSTFRTVGYAKTSPKVLRS